MLLQVLEVNNQEAVLFEVCVMIYVNLPLSFQHEEHSLSGNNLNITN